MALRHRGAGQPSTPPPWWSTGWPTSGTLWDSSLRSTFTMEDSYGPTRSLPAPPSMAPPAVDAQLGLVFFGASDGTLDAVHVSTGNLAWSDSIGGNARAPAFSGGEIYVTSSSGAVEAIVESTGAVTWTHPLSAMGGAAAVDLTGNFVAVGEAGGDVLGLNAATGATLWTYHDGGFHLLRRSSRPDASSWGPVTTECRRSVETTGKLDWSFTTSGAVEDSGSISGNRSGGVTALFIGSEGGYLYGLNAATGRLDLNVKVGSPVMGVSTANGIAVIETAKGGISATRTWVSQLDWTYSTAATLTTTPVLEDGSIYVSGTDGNVYTFSTEGQPPVSRSSAEGAFSEGPRGPASTGENFSRMGLPHVRRGAPGGNPAGG